MISADLKTCTQCRLDKPLVAEHFSPLKRGGFHSRCKPCNAKNATASYWRNPERHRQAARDYAKANPEKVRAANKKWRDANPKEKKPRVRPVGTWRERNLERDKERCRRSASASQKRRRVERAAYFRKLRATHPHYQLRTSVGNSIRKQIATGAKGRRRWSELVGYSIDELKSHLERQFAPWMTWKNYGSGGWVIDHIIPMASFKFETPNDPEFKACWALSNLRPLSDAENFVKRHKRLHLL